MLNSLMVLASLTAIAPDYSILQAPVGITVTTGLLSGTAEIAAKVPGTFAGSPPKDLTNARFFSHVDFCADSPVLGDYVDSISVEDTDGVIPVPARANVPSYPTVINFSTDTSVMGSNNAGYYMVGGCITVGTLDGTLKLVPSGLYLKATIHSGVSKTFRVNIVWGRYSAGF